MNKLISITIPTYNGEKYLKECILSIQNQNMNTEIIVVDDISTDKTVEIAKSMGCRVIVNEVHKGQVAGKNTGIKASKGEYWLTIDQDDILVEGALNKLYQAIDCDESSKIVMAKLKDFCSADTPEQKRFCKKEPFYGILTGSAIFRKDIFNTIGYFREDIITGDVIDLTSRLKKFNIEIKKVDFISCARRIHTANYGKTNQKEEYQDYAKILRERIKMLAAHKKTSTP